MRLLRRSDTGEFSLTQFRDDAVPPYAILSHTWGADAEEVTFDDLIKGTGKDKHGYEKIRFCGEQAALDDLEYFWIDTCCINKANKAELEHAINSMFRWYRNATRCYVYLSDVSDEYNLWTLGWNIWKRGWFTRVCKPQQQLGLGSVDGNDKHSTQPWESSFRESRWFTRGWTLQELLAPGSVEFFSQERKRLGDRSSLEQLIYEITGIPKAALQGTPLSRFSVNERLSWIKRRGTKLEEDQAYSLLGILDAYIPPLYGEGTARAFKRLMDEIDKRDKCIQDLHLTDPCDDKKRIEETKGGLLEGSYRWILENSDFQRWRDDEQSRLLWVKGDPGKGKTMLLCGIINELSRSVAKESHLCYFFCQATDPRINSATAVLRGLLYLLVNQQPSLVSHIRKKYDHTGKALFEDANACIALSEIFTDILQDPGLNSTYLVIDALDECVTDLLKLLDFIVQNSSVSSRIKWLVTSRNETFIERRLQLGYSGTRLSLELKENATQVSHAVNVYIDHCLSELPEIQYDSVLLKLSREKMQQKAGGTFLWVSLVIKELKEVMIWEVLQVLEEVPTELKDVYRRMMKKIEGLRRQDSELCRQVLSTVVAAYRPLRLQELHLLSGLPTKVQDVNEVTTTIVKMCGSFLTIREGSVFIIHQSARDFLSVEAHYNIFPCGIEDVHHSIFSKSLQGMSKTLRRDMYNLRQLGYPAEQVKQPDPDPLATSRYSCIYWVDHLCDWNSSSINHGINFQDKDAIENFIKKKYIYWLEALSLCRSMSVGVLAIAKLDALAQRKADTPSFIKLVQDARLFTMYHLQAIQNSPLQVYVSALLFSPERSLIRSYFKEEEPKWFSIKPGIGDGWSACVQTLKGHSGSVYSVAFSPDSTRFASASSDNTVKLWDASSGDCVQTLKGHSGYVYSVAFSPDSTRLASASGDGIVKIWDASSGDCIQTLKGHSGLVRSVTFSPDSTRLASASGDKTVKIWDASSGDCVRTLKGHSGYVYSAAFSPDSTRLASASYDKTVKVWDASSGDCVQTLKGHGGPAWSVAFSPGSTRLASASYDKTVKIWDAVSGDCVQTLKGHSDWVWSVAFSPDSTRLVSASCDKTVKIWDASSGDCAQTLKGHSSSVWSVTFSPDSTRLASASSDKMVKIWDASSGDYVQTLKGHSDWVWSVAFSPDSTRLASASYDKTVKIWDASSGDCVQTLKGHSGSVWSVAFSPDSTRLASASYDKTVKIWDAGNGDCLQTLDFDRALPNNISFNATGSCLHTEMGSIAISAPPVSNDTTAITKPQHPEYQHVALSSDRAWITFHAKKLVWLPFEYRPSCSAISGKTIGMGVRSGKVWICNIELDEP